MCLSLDDDLIKIQYKTDEFKYEFLRKYIPIWNSIICGKSRTYRAIVETHAGTGYVTLGDKKKYGSSLILLQKTALKQEAMDFHFIEKDDKNFQELSWSINEIIKKGFYFPGDKKGKNLVGEIRNGIPIMKEIPKYPPSTRFPDKDHIFLYNKLCIEAIKEVLKKVEGRPTFFFIDPCGKLEWELVDYIIRNRLIDENGNNRLDEDGEFFQGTELFINFSWEAILRNKSEKFNEERRDLFFKEMYGMNLHEIDIELKNIKKKFKLENKRCSEYQLYLEIFMSKLKRNFKFVSKLDVPGIKSIKNPIYCLIFCTNNNSAKNIFLTIETVLNKKKKGYIAMKNLVSNKKDFTIEKYNEILKGNRLLDDFL
ncbi:MAG: three-Cys-motif partner protein TcmP [Candidatus Odinarchaeota archaeon]